MFKFKAQNVQISNTKCSKSVAKVQIFADKANNFAKKASRGRFFTFSPFSFQLP